MIDLVNFIFYDLNLVYEEQLRRNLKQSVFRIKILEKFIFHVLAPEDRVKSSQLLNCSRYFLGENITVYCLTLVNVLF